MHSAHRSVFRRILGGAALSLFPLMALAESASHRDIPRIIVTSDPLGNRTADELILPVTVITDAALQRRQAGTLGEVLEGLPGVHNSDFGPGVGRPVVRGLQGSRVQTLEDGLATADISGEGADHTIAIDPSRATQIEVFRGPATLLYGSGAAGGVINVRTNRFNPEFGEAPRIEGSMAYGSNAADRQGRLGLELPVNEHLVLRADLSGRKTNDFAIQGYAERGQREGKRGTLNNSALENHSHALSALFKDTWGFVGVGYSLFESKYQIPGQLDADGEGELVQIPTHQDRFDLRSELHQPLAGIETARLKIAHTRYRQTEIEREFDDFDLEEQETTRLKNRETDMRLELVHAPIGLWQGVVGLQWNDRKMHSPDDAHNDHAGHGHSFYVRDNSAQSAGLFLLEERPTDFGRIELAARYDHVKTEPKRANGLHIDDLSGNPGTVRGAQLDGDELEQDDKLSNRSFHLYSLSAGTIVDIDSSHHVRLAITRSQRAPSPEQLYAFGEHHAIEAFEVGDPRLKKETYTNLELGFDRHTGQWRYDLTAFYNHARDFVFLTERRAVDDGAVVTADGETLLFNTQRNARFYGAEFVGVLDVIEGRIPLSVRLTADVVRGKLTNGDNLPRMAPARFGIGLDTGYGPSLTASLDYQRVFEQRKIADLEDTTQGYNLLSANLSWAPRDWQGVEFTLKGRNLLNEDGRRHTSFRKDAVPILGRSIFAGIQFEFGG